MEDEMMAAILSDMDEADAEAHIEDWVVREKKIVTSKLVSNRLKVPLDVARKHLERFYSDEDRRKKLNLFAIYYLSGHAEKNGLEVYKAGLVRDKNLDEAKERFDSVSSCHIFSVQCADIKNVAAALVADSHEIGKNDYDYVPISCANAERRLGPEAARLSLSDSSSKYFESPSKEKQKSKEILEPMLKRKETAAEPDSTKSKNPSKDTVPKKPEPASTSTKPKTGSKDTIQKKQPAATSKDTAPKKAETGKKNANEKKRPATGSGGAAPKKQATLTAFFKKA